MNASIPYLEKYNKINVKLNKILYEYNKIQDKLEDVTDHGNQTLVQKKYHLLKKGFWKEDKDLFPHTLEASDQIKSIFDFNSITYRSIQPNTAYNWHVDPGQMCFHIPLITNSGCWFIYEHRCFHMPADGSVYVVNNGRPHTFVNSGFEPRVHLTFEIL